MLITAAVRNRKRLNLLIVREGLDRHSMLASWRKNMPRRKKFYPWSVFRPKTSHKKPSSAPTNLPDPTTWKQWWSQWCPRTQNYVRLNSMKTSIYKRKWAIQGLTITKQQNREHTNRQWISGANLFYRNIPYNTTSRRQSIAGKRSFNRKRWLSKSKTKRESCPNLNETLTLRKPYKWSSQLTCPSSIVLRIVNNWTWKSKIHWQCKTHQISKYHTSTSMLGAKKPWQTYQKLSNRSISAIGWLFWTITWTRSRVSSGVWIMARALASYSRFSHDHIFIYIHWGFGVLGSCIFARNSILL